MTIPSRRAPASSTRASVIRLTIFRFWSAVRPCSIVIWTIGIGHVPKAMTFPRFRWSSVEESATGHIENLALLRQFVSREEEAEFETSRVFAIGAVDCVELDVRRPLLADS